MTEKAPGKLVYIEFLRIIACFLVYVNHTNSDIFYNRGPSLTWFASLTYFFLSKIAMPLFLLIMGALLLNKTDSPKRSAERLCRMAAVLIVSSALYHVFYAWKDHTPVDFLAFLREFPTQYSSNALWYLYLYLGLLCLLPILQRLIKNMEPPLIRWTIFLSVGLLGGLPVIQAFFPSIGLSSYFLEPLFSPYVGLVLCGFYIEHCVTVTKKMALTAGCTLIGLIAFQTAGTFFLWRRNPSPSFYLGLDNSKSLLVAACAVSVYIMVKYLFTHASVSARVENTVCAVGRLTFGMYLLGDMAIELTRPMFGYLDGFLPSMAAVLLWELAVFVLCVLCSALLHRIPVIKRCL